MTKQFIELDSNGFVTWECFDTLPYLVTVDGVSANLNYRPAFYPDEGLYRAVADGNDDSYMIEWQGTAEQCDWKRPCRVLTLDEFNLENVGNAKDHVVAESKRDLLGNRIYDSVVPARQLSLFDKTEFTRKPLYFPAVVVWENGEQAFGKIDSRTPKKELAFTEHATGKKFIVPLQYCNVTWAGQAAIIDIAEHNLMRNVSWHGMFASCRLF